MKNYSKAGAHKGKAAYRTPSRWLAGRPEGFKKRPGTKLHRSSVSKMPWYERDFHPEH